MSGWMCLRMPVVLFKTKSTLFCDYLVGDSHDLVAIQVNDVWCNVYVVCVHTHASPHRFCLVYTLSYSSWWFYLLILSNGFFSSHHLVTFVSYWFLIRNILYDAWPSVTCQAKKTSLQAMDFHTVNSLLIMTVCLNLVFTIRERRYYTESDGWGMDQIMTRGSHMKT